MNKKLLLAATMAFMSLTAYAATDNTTVAAKDGKLNYKVDARGNRVLDFSYCGYYDSSRPIPDVRNVIYVAWQEGDNSSRIQKAIDYAASLPVGKDGYRGSVLLGKGDFRIDTPLRISNSGIVLRGSGVHETTITKHGFDRGALLYIEGTYNPVVTDTIAIPDSYVPVNSRELKLGASLKAGQNVFILRPSTAEWIADMKCDIFGGGISALGWKAGDVDLRWDREVTADNNGTVTLDAPLTMALDKKYGTTLVLPYTWTGRISNVGVENLTLVSDYNKKYPKDEDHCWNGIYVADAQNCFVREVDFRHFAGSAVILQSTASRVTVEDCRATEPVSETGGMRRQVFLSLGQLNLFQRCYSKNGIHDFAAGMYAPGPNAFVQCDSEESLGFSGAIDAWAPGLLFDIVNIDGNNITFKNLGQDKNGAGWNTGNSLMWQCTASELECFTPADDAINQVYGSWGQFSGDGLWAQSNNHVQPRSFFYAQLAERLDSVPEAQSRILPRATNATSSPTVEAAMQLAHEAATVPRLTLPEWIEEASFTASVDPAGIKSVDNIKLKSDKKATNKDIARNDYAVSDGKITLNGAAITGGRLEVPWWNGKIKPNYTVKAKPAVTRFVPGREGLGLTDRVDSVISYMNDNDIAVLDHNYGLWYERRRDDHERIRRQNGDVWAPFYEQPFARSGEGTAWDGLSRYDLTRPNEYYWNRLNEFADKAADNGKLLFNEMYFQHNIIEAGAHWVDSPWRSVNNVNNTGFPEPVPFAGDKRVFMAEPFYDVNNPVRRDLHRNFIRMNLDKLADNPNVVHLISAEYTGPQHFMEFWLDAIDEWQRETGKDVKVALSATKDVQDAILANPKYKDVVDIIDIRYWHYKTDGIYAPEGGKNLAPRQHARKMKVGKITFPEAYRAVSEYRTKYPEKAVTYYAQNYPDMAWAVFMGGGSLAGVPVKDNAFLKASAKMQPVATPDEAGYKALKGNGGMIVYAQESGDYRLALPAGKYSVTAFDAKTGEKAGNPKSLKTFSGTVSPIQKPHASGEPPVPVLSLPAKAGQVYLIKRN